MTPHELMQLLNISSATMNAILSMVADVDGFERTYNSDGTLKDEAVLMIMVEASHLEVKW